MEPTQKKSNSTMYVVLGLIIVAIVVALVISGNKKEDAMENVVTPGVEDATSTPDPVVGAIDPTKEGTSLSNAGTYADLVLKYEDKTLQFDKECKVSKQNTIGFKQGTDVLLDNRGDKSAKIVLGSRTFTLKAYGYKVIDLGSVGTYKVDCNDRQNVLTVTVQK